METLFLDDQLNKSNLLKRWQQYLVVVDLDALELEFRGADVVAGGIDSVLVGNDFPELKLGNDFDLMLRVFSLNKYL